MTEQNKAYQRGYAAGKRWADREERERERAHARRMALYTLAAAIAPEIIRNPWHQNGKALNTMDGIAGTITDIILAVERRLG